MNRKIFIALLLAATHVQYSVTADKELSGADLKSQSYQEIEEDIEKAMQELQDATTSGSDVDSDQDTVTEDEALQQATHQSVKNRKKVCVAHSSGDEAEVEGSSSDEGDALEQSFDDNWPREKQLLRNQFRGLRSKGGASLEIQVSTSSSDGMDGDGDEEESA